MARVGFVGWRGMVGSVLMQRMIDEGDFAGLSPVFFSTSQVGVPGPEVGGTASAPMENAYDLDALAAMDVIVTCQGGDYTKAVHEPLRGRGWAGYWIDAASALRLERDSLIVLDPVNGDRIERALESGIRTYVGGNCTVSLMLMALSGLFRESLIEWISPMTYQAASGAGAANMRELVAQMGAIHAGARNHLDPASAILELDRSVGATLMADAFPRQHFGAPLAGNVLPWIDSEMPGGQSREEWKAEVETARILGLADGAVPIDGLCVRVGAMRSHAQALTIRLSEDVPIDRIESLIAGGNDWVRVVPNERERTLQQLTPAAASGRLDVPIGRLRKLSMGGRYLAAFTVGDQLLWGAAEPLRRMLAILRRSGRISVE